MKKLQSTSYGIIPCIQEDRKWKVFLIQHHRNLFWGFPKGHAEKGESPLEAAQRELFEETGLQVIKLLKEESFLEEYVYQEEGSLVEKKVFFYLAITSKEFKLDHKEVIDGKWLSFEEAKKIISYKEGLELLARVHSTIKRISL